MKIGVCGIACEKCPRMTKVSCLNGETGCIPRENPFCKIASCAFAKNVRLYFECPDFSCEVIRGRLAMGTALISRVKMLR
jgi:hypothetical protein